MPRKLFLLLVFLLAASTALAWPGRKKKPLPPPTEELSTPAALRFLWPPSRDNFVNLVALIVFVWIVVLEIPFPVRELSEKSPVPLPPSREATGDAGTPVGTPAPSRQASAQ